MFAEVIVDLKYQDSHMFYDYIIPEKYRSFLVRGMRVIVPFQHQMKLGVISRIKESSELAQKEIDEVLDSYPSVGEEIFMMVDHIKKHSLYPYPAIFYHVLPKELFMNIKKIVYQIAPIEDVEIASKFNRDGIWRLKKSDQIYMSKLKKLKDENRIDIDIEVSKYSKPKYETYYVYQDDHTYQKAYLEEELIHKFRELHMMKKSDVIDHGMSIQRIKTWLKHGVIKEEKHRIMRVVEHSSSIDHQEILLTQEQHQISLQINQSLNQHQAFLMKGSIHSGRYEVYLKIIENVIKNGQKVLFIVPEIMQITDIEHILQSHFKHVTIYHSGLSKGIANDAFERIISSEADIVLGTRSATFLPIPDLGIIIVDDEHDPSYINQEGIYYDVKDLLKLKSEYHHIPVVYGSATPSIVSMYQAKHKKMYLMDLDIFQHKQRSLITIVDMKEELKQKNTSIISSLLKTKIDNRLSKHEQVILLYNKKGYAPYVLCRDCGHVPKCPHCDVSLTFYKSKNILKCHYCGYEEPFEKECSICHSHQVKEVGVGIEYVESVVQKTFPQARILRLDKEIIKTKQQHEIIDFQFKHKQADILIGTQMISNGLALEHVSLVGIILADQSFRIPTFDSHEQAYMLFSQIKDRMGYHQNELIVQAYDVKHKTLQWLTSSYDTFYQDSIKTRKLLNYPPFVKISTVMCEGQSLLTTYQHAFRIKKTLISNGFDVLGPTEALINKIKDHYRFALTIKFQPQQTPDVIKVIEPLKHQDVNVSYEPTIER